MAEKKTSTEVIVKNIRKKIRRMYSTEEILIEAHLCLADEELHSSLFAITTDT